jgi:diguanylate cyclase (GGDEF)-like protein
LNLNDFKNVNDTLGHNIGDEILKKVTLSIVNVLRKSDVVCRFDGDKFIMLLEPVTDRAHIEDTARSVVALFSAPFKMREHEFYITANAGISVFPDDGTNEDALIKNAGIAMNRAKTDGPNRYAVCSADMKEDVAMSTMLSNSLFRPLSAASLLSSTSRLST